MTRVAVVVSTAAVAIVGGLLSQLVVVVVVVVAVVVAGIVSPPPLWQPPVVAWGASGAFAICSAPIITQLESLVCCWSLYSCSGAKDQFSRASISGRVRFASNVGERVLSHVSPAFSALPSSSEQLLQRKLALSLSLARALLLLNMHLYHC